MRRPGLRPTPHGLISGMLIYAERNELMYISLSMVKHGTDLGNGSKNGSIEVEICSPSGRGLSVLVTRTSMQASPSATPCVAS